MSSGESFLIQKFTEGATISKDAILSGGWQYPLIGIYYFLSHPSLYRSIAPTLLKLSLLSMGVTLAMFVLTYLPQLAICAIFSGPLAFVAAFTLVLSESYAIILFISKALFLGKAMDAIFDAVLLQQGNEQLVSRGRLVTKNSSGIKKLGTSLTKPLNRFSKDGITRYFISFPLNALPVVGTVAFLVYNGIKAGPGYHARYFQLKNLDAPSRKSFVEKRKGAYTAFGATALALNLVPLAGLIFGFTSIVGAALWASNMEKKNASGGARFEDEVAVEL